MPEEMKIRNFKDPDEIRFETYRNYLSAIQNYLIETHGDWERFAGQCIDGTGSDQPRTGLESSWIERFMKLAWNTEYLLTSNQPEPEMVRINNQWTPIQCYYAVYSAAEALGYAIDGQKSDGHKKTLRKITEYFIKTKMTPWNLAYEGAQGNDKKQARPKNFPEDLKLAHNLQRQGVQPISLIAKCLKAEHSNRIEDIYKRQSKTGRRKKASINPGETGLLHFLYKLRVKANYQNMDIFLASVSTDRSLEFAKALDTVCCWTLTLMEIKLIRKCRPKSIFNMAEKYLRINPRATSLNHRLDFYKKYFKSS